MGQEIPTGKVVVIIESAFLKLPELLSASSGWNTSYETTVVHFLATALYMELDCRNISNLYEHIQMERPYPSKIPNRPPLRSDLFLVLPGAGPATSPMAHQYGLRECNWVEVKTFLGEIKANSSPAKTSSNGQVVKDFLRLCLLPEEYMGRIRQNARYFLAIFANPPNKHLTLRKRTWLNSMFSENSPEIEIIPSQEPATFQAELTPKSKDLSGIKLSFGFKVLDFKPEDMSLRPRFWGYLFRIKSFKIEIPKLNISSDGTPKEHWDSQKIANYSAVRNYIFEKVAVE